jgi:hypothetical protein
VSACWPAPRRADEGTLSPRLGDGNQIQIPLSGRLMPILSVIVVLGRHEFRAAITKPTRSGRSVVGVTPATSAIAAVRTPRCGSKVPIQFWYSFRRALAQFPHSFARVDLRPRPARFSWDCPASVGDDLSESYA